MDEIITPAPVEEPIAEGNPAPENAETPPNEQEAASTPSVPKTDEDAPEQAKAPQKPSKKPSAEIRMIEALLKCDYPEALAKGLEDGKTLEGAWNYIVSVMRNAYITQYGRVNGGMVGSPDVMTSLAKAYLESLPEGYTEPEVKPEAKKSNPAPKTDAKAAAKKVVETAKKAAKDAKKEAKPKAPAPKTDKAEDKRKAALKAWAQETFSFG